MAFIVGTTATHANIAPPITPTTTDNNDGNRNEQSQNNENTKRKQHLEDGHSAFILLKRIFRNESIAFLTCIT